jgi:hypothetical protein
VECREWLFNKKNCYKMKADIQQAEIYRYVTADALGIAMCPEQCKERRNWQISTDSQTRLFTLVNTFICADFKCSDGKLIIGHKTNRLVLILNKCIPFLGGI